MAERGKGGQVFPVQAVGLYGWNPDDGWQQLTLTGGTMDVNLTSINGTALTGDDWTLRFQALNDDTVEGLFRSIGDAGATPTNTTGKTLLQLQTEALAAISAMSSAITAVLSTAYQSNTVLDAAIAANGDLDLDTGLYGGRTTVCLHAEHTDAMGITVYGSPDNINFVKLFEDLTTIAASVGGTISQSFDNAYRYLRVTVSGLAGTGAKAFLAASR